MKQRILDLLIHLRYECKQGSLRVGANSQCNGSDRIKSTLTGNFFVYLFSMVSLTASFPERASSSDVNSQPTSQIFRQVSFGTPWAGIFLTAVILRCYGGMCSSYYLWGCLYQFLPAVFYEDLDTKISKSRSWIKNKNEAGYSRTQLPHTTCILPGLSTIKRIAIATVIFHLFSA